MSALFAYGTLMNPDVFCTISGMTRDGLPARLEGYERYAVRNADYPGIRPTACCAVDGVVYQGLSEEAWQRLDHYEGDEYERVWVQVTMQPEAIVCEVYTYVFKNLYVDRLENPC